MPPVPVGRAPPVTSRAVHEEGLAAPIIQLESFISSSNLVAATRAAIRGNQSIKLDTKLETIIKVEDVMMDKIQSMKDKLDANVASTRSLTKAFSVVRESRIDSKSTDKKNTNRYMQGGM